MGFRFMAAALALALALTISSAAAWAAPLGGSGVSSAEYELKIAVERHLEERLNPVLKEIAGTDNVVAIVRAEIDTARNKPDEPAQSKLVLPGVPARAEVSQMASADQSSHAVVKRLDVTIILDRRATSTLSDTIHDIAIPLIGYNPDRGDRIEIKEMSFVTKSFDWTSMFRPPYLFWLIALALTAAFVSTASVYFVGRVRIIERTVKAEEAAVAATKQAADAGPIQIPTVFAGGLPETGSSSSTAADSYDGLDRPFRFITEKRSTDLSLILQDAPVAEVATVLNYIDPGLAVQLLDEFSPDRQAEIALAMSKPSELKADEVRALEGRIRDRMTYVVGGEQRAAALVARLSEEARDEYFEKIEAADHALADRVRGRVKTFESMLRGASQNSIQTLVRQMPPAAFARVLMSAPGDVQSRVLDSLSPGAAERIREEMKFSQPLKGRRLAREKRLVVELYDKLAAAGMIDEEGA